MSINIAIEYDQLLNWLRQLPDTQKRQLMTEMWVTDTAPQEISAFDAFAFNGLLHLKEDPLTIQKKLRDEWD